MAAGGKQATKWLKGEIFLPPPVILNAAGLPTSGSNDGLYEIKAFWQKKWMRDSESVRVQELADALDAGLFRHRLSSDNWLPAASILQAKAKHMAGTAPGLDGWDAKELALLPEAAFELFRSLAGVWGARQQWPSVWQNVRQVHLRKDEASPLEPCAVKNMRPISIFSTWYRLLTSCFMSQEHVKAWIEAVLPPQAHGGIRNRWVATALQEILPQLDQGGAALALDYAKCFDHVNPKLVLLHLQLHRWPNEMVSLLQHVWLNQTRWLQLGQCTLMEPVQVQTSLPQGDPVSPLGLLLVLSEGIADICNTCPEVSMTTFLDDRVLVAKSVKTLMHARRKWTTWSNRLGLIENDHKTVAFASNYQQRMAFLKFGFSTGQVQSQFRVLGVDVLASSEQLGKTHEARLAQGHAAAVRLTRAPVDVTVREGLWCTRILPKITWGWWLSEVPDTVQNNVFQLFRKVADVHKMASVHLRMVLNGHALSFPFMVLQHSISALRAAGFAGLPWAEGTGMWIRSVNSTLEKWGWNIVAPWQWQHQHEGAFQLLQSDKAELDHKIRESWRRVCWSNFCAQDRRDSRHLAAVPYSSARIKATQRLFGCTSKHGRAVLTGAANSLSCYQVMFEQTAEAGCDLCGDRSVFPDWYHLTWKCTAFAAGRPPEPVDPVQLRLAWPPSDADPIYNDAVLIHMAAVRARILSFAPSGRGRQFYY